MTKYYFTYGSADSSHPFVGGWTEIEAPNIDMAYAAFAIFHISEANKPLPFSMCYTEEEFLASRMSKVGNAGYGCHERICLTRELTGGAE